MLWLLVEQILFSDDSNGVPLSNCAVVTDLMGNFFLKYEERFSQCFCAAFENMVPNGQFWFVVLDSVRAWEWSECTLISSVPKVSPFNLSDCLGSTTP